MKSSTVNSRIAARISVLAFLIAGTIPFAAQTNTWSSGAAMPTARFGPAFGIIKGKIYVVGGGNGGGVLAVNEVYNPTTNSWTTRAPMPTARFAVAGAVVNGILYVIGGCDAGCATGTGAMTVVEAYNPSTNSWSTKSPLPTATDSAYAVAIKGIIYVVGGYVPGVGRVPTVYAYNPSTDSWTQVASMKVAKSTPATGVSGGIIAAGGWGNNNGPVADSERYSVSGNTWKTLPAIPTARAASCFGKISGKFYVGGGADANNNSLDALEAYVPLTKSWTTSLAAMPVAVVGPASAVYKGKLYCIGGSNNGGLFQGTVYDNVQIYQP